MSSQNKFRFMADADLLKIFSSKVIASDDPRLMNQLTGFINLYSKNGRLSAKMRSRVYEMILECIYNDPASFKS